MFGLKAAALGLGIVAVVLAGPAARVAIGKVDADVGAEMLRTGARGLAMAVVEDPITAVSTITAPGAISPATIAGAG